MNVFRVDILRPGKAQRLEVTTHPAFIVLELSRGLRAGARVFWNIDPSVFTFVVLRKIELGSEMIFPNKPSGVASLTENITHVHIVAFECNIEIGEALVFFPTNFVKVPFAM